MGRSAIVGRKKKDTDRAGFPPVAATIGRLPCSWPSVRDLFTDCGDRGETRARRVRDAQAVCATCPVKRECGDWAAETGQPGVWGGQEAIGRAVRKRRATGGKVNQYA